jgi:hypothetical protein
VQPGEESSWNAEFLFDGSHLQTAGTLSEARNWHNPEFLVHVWHSNDNTNTLWGAISENNTLGIATNLNIPFQALGSPVVVPFGQASFQIFYTGTNHHIYRAAYNPLTPGATLSNLRWNDTNLTSDLPPHAAQLGAGQGALGVVWRANDASHSIRYATYIDGFSGVRNLGGNAVVSPSVTYDPETQRIWAAHTGTDGHIYLNHRNRSGGGRWGAWVNYGGQGVGTPTIAATPSGTVAVASRAPDATIWYLRVNEAGTAVGGWQQDITRAQSSWDVGLSVNDDGDVYALLTGEDNNTYYKKAMDD